jgi:amidohydrolase
LKDSILSLCDRLEDKFVLMRRALHQIAEPSFAEHKTQNRICSYLKAAGIEHRRMAQGTGVVGLIKGGAGRTVALRADMDALNLEERTGLSFASRTRGLMHACGHDAHMAMVLGTGLVLKHFGGDLPGAVRLVFQPAEETPPGGAVSMIKQGALRRPRASAIIGVHVDPAIHVGKVAVNAGTISAAADDFTVTISGKGGHGSSPHKSVDAIVVAADFINSLQTVVSRKVSPLDSVVVSIGHIKGGERNNIIAETVEMDGTIRTKTGEMRRRVPAMVKRLLRNTCSAHGAKGEFKYVRGYPAVFCDPALSKLVSSACSGILGRSRTITSPGLEMGGEDFAYYAQKVPGTMVFVGVGNPDRGKIHFLHHSKFDIDEDALKVGVAALAYSAYTYLDRNGGKARGKGK